MDKIAYQKEMEKLFHKNQLIPRIKKEFTDCKEMNFSVYMKAKEINEDFGYDLLVQMVLHKRVKLAVIVGILRRHFMDSQATVDELHKAAEANLVDWNPVTEQFILRINISPDVQEELDRYQYPLPMIVEPRELITNHDSAYLTGSGSVILKQNHHEDDVCLDHLNRVNAVKFKINHITATMIQNQWKGLDKPKEDEEFKDYQRRVKQFEKYDRTAKDVMTHLEIADNEFYLTHKYDKRGRIYCQGYHVNYQGTPWNKSVIEFAEGEIVL
ncbi:RNA polymerase 1 [Sinorhizobium phage ort11]|uniref:RNA polymerase 1 n=1 Tax=Sinorhizobium phage ort11 TaxID=2599764 RepID=A0A5C2H204_9CAUD|nr:RNA polymerase 1 [Sinorhizobium phage ort11]QEP29830.1 RNA polymerase 1 [Sinorhizobium phage ort11]